MPDGSALIYLYDGSFDGLLCCVFESFVQKETPLDILPLDTSQCFLYEHKEIVTDYHNAHRVHLSLEKKISAEAKSLIETAFLYGDDEKALCIYRFIKLGYQQGAKITAQFGDETVSALHGMVRAVNNEAHLMTGFVRFSDYEGSLVAVIEPKHWILPKMQDHFCSRFPSEQFLIFDKTHGMALVHGGGRAELIAIESLELPAASPEEQAYRNLWRNYYRSIGIKERYNPRCRMTHMPKRFWKHLTEMEPSSHTEYAIETLPAYGQNQRYIGNSSGDID